MLHKRISWIGVLATLAIAFAGTAVGQNIGVLVGVGADFDTDAFLAQAGIDFSGLNEMPIGVSGVVAFGVGDQGFGQDGNYNVIRASAKGRYEIPIGEDQSIVAYPLVAPGIYRWSADYGFEGFGGTITETDFVLDVGAGVRFGAIGVEVITSVNGPNFGVRGQYQFPIKSGGS